MTFTVHEGKTKDVVARATVLGSKGPGHTGGHHPSQGNRTSPGRVEGEPLPLGGHSRLNRSQRDASPDANVQVPGLVVDELSHLPR